MLTLPRPPPNLMEGAGHLRRPDGAAARQYAIPADCTPLSHWGANAGGLSYSQHERLRQRKTPNGLLFEQDNPVVDRSVKMPASKHVLLSSSPNLWLGHTSYHNGVTQPQMHGHAFPSQYQQPKGTLNNASVPFMHPPAWDFPGGLDSVLNQTLPMQPSQRYYLQQGSRIPTVLPSALNSNWGPTASAGQELYGPYWPDGTFTPYRPASIRDDRYYAHHFEQQQHSQDPFLNFVNVPQLRRPGRLPTFMADPYYSSTNSHQRLYNDNQRQWHQQSPNQFNHQAPFQELDDCFQQPYPHSQLPYVLQPQQSVGSERVAQPQLLSPLESGLESNQVAFRDRTFTWANKIYTELLAAIQRNARDSHQSNVPNAKSSTKLSIYPKPPKRSGAHFSGCITPGQKELNTARTSSNTWRVEPNVNEIDASRPQTAIWSPSRRASDLGGSLSTKSLNNETSLTYNHYVLAKQEPRRISDSLIRQPGALYQTHALKAEAETALSTMELLCEQAQMPWVDGMLLVGCLAYGLGQHDKALHWYQAILSQDGVHVEAMSNLAATLHALNRRDEALHYWSAAVKLRPSYFEAVEHLIGLLCSTRRAKEAVELLRFVESSLKLKNDEGTANNNSEVLSDGESDAKSRTSSIATNSSIEQGQYDYDVDNRRRSISFAEDPPAPGFGSSGYAIAGSENGRMLALVHAKGNMLYALGDNSAAAEAFEDAILIATGQRKNGVRGLISKILYTCLRSVTDRYELQAKIDSKIPVLLAPNQAEATARNMFPTTGELPGLEHVTKGIALKAAVATTSNSLLSLAKIYQDAMSNATEVGTLRSTSTRDILALYYLSLSLQRSPSTANNVGILLAGVQQSVHMPQLALDTAQNPMPLFPGVVPGSGIHLALLYYNYGLVLDNKHAHLYTNFGSLLKDIGQLNAAIGMYERAVQCDANFDIALANLANAVKDLGRVADAVNYYKRAVQANPEFAEAVCGLATALNSVCNWSGRGGVYADRGRRDPVHVDENGKLQEASRSYGWINRVVEIVDKQLKEGETWGCNTLTSTVIDNICRQLSYHRKSDSRSSDADYQTLLRQSLEAWSGERWEGSRVVRLIERAVRRIGWQWYQDWYRYGKEYSTQRYLRPTLPTSLSTPSAPTVLPFHTFTTPLPAKQIRQISQRNALRISVSTLRSVWLPATVFPPPPPPRPCLKVGYVSSDFNNHPLAHLMQSVFGLHDPSSVHAICYATTASDGSIHRKQIEHEAPAFHDASNWSVERLVKQVVADGVHILVNLNGYTRGARNEVFAARPAPIHMSFMGFAGTLGAEWCDYVLADEISVPPETLSPWRRNVDIEDRLRPDSLVEEQEDWVYSENIIFAKETFFCVDHKQSAPDAIQRPPRLDQMSKKEKDLRWEQEQARRWKLRKQILPTLKDSAVILGNFNQLYKIDPATFRMYLRILAVVPNAVLWLLKFPDLGQANLIEYAKQWAGKDYADRIIFTDVAPKGDHILRASVVDLFLDTPECNAHTTAADVVWSGTPIVTWGRWKYKMCSRMCGSIISSALPEGKEGDKARKELVVDSEVGYVEAASKLARGLKYHSREARAALGEGEGQATGRLMELRRMLWEGRWESRLFDTKRWVRDVERAYWIAWDHWTRAEGGDIWL